MILTKADSSMMAAFHRHLQGLEAQVTPSVTIGSFSNGKTPFLILGSWKLKSRAGPEELGKVDVLGFGSIAQLVTMTSHNSLHQWASL